MEDSRRQGGRTSSIQLAAVAAILAASSSMAVTEPSHPQLTPVVANVLTPPHAVAGSDGRTHLVYEIRIAKVAARTWLEMGVAQSR
jgi:hypothetical protein